jgi:hypothetical protein
MLHAGCWKASLPCRTQRRKIYDQVRLNVFSNPLATLSSTPNRSKNLSMKSDQARSKMLHVVVVMCNVIPE